MDDKLKEFLEAVAQTRIVFWVCPQGCRGKVEWDKGCTVATCKVCGMTSTENRPRPKK